MIKITMPMVEFRTDAKVILRNLSEHPVFELDTGKTQFFVRPIITESLTRGTSDITGYTIKVAGEPDSEQEVVSL